MPPSFPSNCEAFKPVKSSPSSLIAQQISVLDLSLFLTLAKIYLHYNTLQYAMLK